jgi:hypothetical protein
MDPKYRIHIQRPGDESEITNYIEKVYEYVNDGDKGYIEFDGYIYYDIGDENQYTRNLSRCFFYVMDHIDTEKFCPFYEVEFYRREIIKNTNAYSTIEEDDGTEMNVCFFPTDRQRVYFKVLREIKLGEPVPDEYKPTSSVVS